MPHHVQTKFTNMQSFSSILQVWIQLKKIQVEFISSPKYINKGTKWPIVSRKLHATTNNNISKFFQILRIYSSIAQFTPPLGSIACLYPEYRSWSSKDISQHLIVLMKLPNPSVKIRYRGFPCLINVFTWVNGTFLLRSRQRSLPIGSTNIRIHR